MTDKPLARLVKRQRLIKLETQIKGEPLQQTQTKCRKSLDFIWKMGIINKKITPTIAVIIFIFWDSVSLCSPDCPGTFYVDQAGLDRIDSPAFVSPKCWESRHAPPCVEVNFKKQNKNKRTFQMSTWNNSLRKIIQLDPSPPPMRKVTSKWLWASFLGHST